MFKSSSVFCNSEITSVKLVNPVKGVFFSGAVAILDIIQNDIQRRKSAEQNIESKEGHLNCNEKTSLNSESKNLKLNYSL